MKLVRETRGGRLYDAAWGRRMKGEGVYAELLKARFALASRRLGLGRPDWDLDASAFRRPAKPADPNQLRLI